MDRQQVQAALKKMSVHMRQDTYSGGSNNSPTPSAIIRMLQDMNLSRQSVFLDCGSGYGLICIGAALLYGCRCIGIERDSHLVKHSQRSATLFGVDHLCEFVTMDLRDVHIDLLKTWDISCVYSFDAAILPSVKTQYYTTIHDYQTLSGRIHCIMSSSRYLEYPSQSKHRFSMCNGGSSHTMYKYLPCHSANTIYI